ncbi:MAG: DUF1573 domain-containing protein [Planctomycetota bacterium]|jgi:hypothetical protein
MSMPRLHRACRIAAIAASIAAATACDQSGEQGAKAQTTGAPVSSPSDIPAPATTPGPPRLAFASTSHDFGRMSETDERSARFEFANTGGEVLVVKNVSTTCGCTVATLEKRRYQPGERGAIDVVFDPTGPGDRQKKYVNLLTNAKPQELVRLTIAADVEPFLIFEPRMLKLGVLPPGREHRATVAVSCPDEDFVIEAVGTTSPYGRARVVPVDEADRYPGAVASRMAEFVELIIPPDAPWGGFYCALEVTARGRPVPDAEPVTHTSSIRVAAQLFGQLVADPDMFRFGVKPGEAFRRTIQLRRPSGEPFRVLGVSVASHELPDASVAANRVAPDTWEIVLSATGNARATRFRGAVTVTTDVPGEERIDIGILGVVRAR